MNQFLFNTFVLLLVLSMSFSVNGKQKQHKPLQYIVGSDVIFTDGFDGSLLGADPNILLDGAKISFISNSFMGAYGGLNNYLELIVNVADNPVTLNTVPARTTNDGWYWGMVLSQMTSALDRIENEGDYDTCIFLDGSMQTMREFADRLFAACGHVVLFADGGWHNPVTLGNNYLNNTATTLANARLMQSEYPDLLVVPMAYVFYGLTINPVDVMPRLDYLYGDNNIHQNGLGTLINTFGLYSMLTSKSPLGLSFDYDQPATINHSFIDGNDILIGHSFPLDTPNDRILFDESTQLVFQQKVMDLLVEWQQRNTEFD